MLSITLRTVGRLTAVVTVTAAVIAFAAPSGFATSGSPVATSRPAALAPVEMPGGFVAESPKRTVDTNDPGGAIGAFAILPGRTENVSVGAFGLGPGGAVVVDFTVLNAAASGYVTLYPSGTTRPTVSNLNFLKGQTIDNLAVVRVQDGRFTVYNGSSGTLQFVVDEFGYFLSGAAVDPGAYAPLTPARILDTRLGTGAPKAPVKAQGTLNLTVTGRGGVPASGVSAVVLNVTVTQPGGAGYLTAYPTGVARPTASSLNFTAGANVPNLVTLGVGSAGRVSLFNGSGKTVQLVADVAGYFLAGTPTKGGAYVPVTPTRFLDSRSHLGARSGPLATGHTIDVQAQYLGGTGASHTRGVPLTNVSAVMANLTTTGEQGAGHLNIDQLKSLTPAQDVWNISYAKGMTRANATLVRPGLCGQVKVSSRGAATDVVADAAGYFLAADVDPTPPPAVNVSSWGDNAFGSLADGSFTSSNAPHATLGLSGITAVAADGHVLARSTDGLVYAWGANYDNTLGNDLDMDSEQGNDGCAIPFMVHLSDVAAVAVGESSSYALTNDGSVWAWGDNELGQLGDGTATEQLDPQEVPGLTDVVAIAASGSYALALKSDGTVWGWGSEFYGELGGGTSVQRTPVQLAPSTLTGITAIAAGNVDAYALTSDGHVLAWGANLFGELGNGAPQDNLAHPTPTAVTGLSGVQKVFAGSGDTAAALLSDGTVMAWGLNERGELGHGQTPAQQFWTGTPVEVTGLGHVVSVSYSADNAMALESDGTVWTWGAAGGNAASADRTAPVQVAGLSAVTAIAQGPSSGYSVS